MFLIVCYFLAKKVIKQVWQHRLKSAAQKKAVNARYRNYVTAAMMKDIFNIRIAGIWSVEKTAKEAFEALMPFTLQELEEVRKKNPEAWREVMEYLLPLALAVKHKIQETPKQMITDTVGGILNATPQIKTEEEEND